MPHKVVLHVGSPKTGTTFLQQVLWSQRDLARELGLLLPLTSFHDHYLASLDVRGLSYEPRYPPRAIGIWTALVEEGLAFDGNVLVSHELFAGATAAQAVAAVGAWGDVDVHVVVTARDLVRQIPAEWQEHIKHRSAVTFTDFVGELKTHGQQAKWFWTVQDYADVCRRWGAAVPPERVHVVTVPPRGSGLEALWERFAGFLGLEAAAFDLEVSKTNRSLRAEQTELLRRVNAQLGARLVKPGAYPETVKEILAQEVLAGRPGGARVALSGDDWTYAVERSRRMVEELRSLGVDVIGDLAELTPTDAFAESGTSDGTTDHPEATPDAVLLTEGIEALSGLLERLSEQLGRVREHRAREAAQRQSRLELEELTRENERLRQERESLLDDFRRRPLRRALIAQTERHQRLMKLRVTYWRVVNLARRLSGREFTR